MCDVFVCGPRLPGYLEHEHGGQQALEVGILLPVEVAVRDDSLAGNPAEGGPESCVGAALAALHSSPAADARRPAAGWPRKLLGFRPAFEIHGGVCRSVP